MSESVSTIVSLYLNTLTKKMSVSQGDFLMHERPEAAAYTLSYRLNDVYTSSYINELSPSIVMLTAKALVQQMNHHIGKGNG